METCSDTLKVCRQAAKSIHDVYDRIFQHPYSSRLAIDIEQVKEIKFLFGMEQTHFLDLISMQRTLVSCASREPCLWFFSYGFSSSRYRILVQHQLDMFRILHSMDATVS